MYRRSVQRGATALAFVLVMSLAGAEPAAAASPGFLGRLASAWSAVTGASGQALTGVLDRLSGRARFAAQRGRAGAQEKKGMGIDPNGATVAIEVEDEPSDVTGSTGGH